MRIRRTIILSLAGLVGLAGCDYVGFADVASIPLQASGPTIPEPETKVGSVARGTIAGGLLGTAVGFGAVVASLGACINPFAAATCPSVAPFLLGGAALGGAAGAVAGRELPLTRERNDRQTKIVLDKTFEQAWGDTILVAAVSEKYFQIETFDKDSGLVTLRLSNSPHLAICSPPASDAKIAGEMRVKLEQVSESQTRLEVKTRYNVTSRWAAWSFKTGETSTNYHGFCRPSHIAERRIISGVSEGYVLASAARSAETFATKYDKQNPAIAMLLRQRSRAFFEAECSGAVGTDEEDLEAMQFDMGEPGRSRAINKLVGRLHDAADACTKLQRYAEAETLYKRAVNARESSLGPNHPEDAKALSKLARFYHARGRYDDAESIYKRELAIHQKSTMTGSAARTLDALAQLYDDQGRHAEAERIRNRSQEQDPSPYCYRPAANSMLRVYLMDCPPDTVFASRSEYAEWNASREDYREKFGARGGTE